MSDIKLTELEKDVLQGVYNSEYTDGATSPNIWSWSIRAKIATPRQIPGVVGSLNKKGVLCSEGSGVENATMVTPLGEEVARENGIGYGGF